jgi:hypothetical protein
MLRIDHDLDPGVIKFEIGRVYASTHASTYKVTDSRVVGNPKDPAAAHELVALMIYAVQGKLDISRVHSDDLLPFLMILAWCGHDATFDALLLRNSIHADVREFAAWAVKHELVGYTTTHSYSVTRCFGNMSVKITLRAYRGLYWVDANIARSGQVNTTDQKSAQQFIDEVSSQTYVTHLGIRFGCANDVRAAISAFKGDIPALKSFHASYVIEALPAAYDPKTIEFIKSIKASLHDVEKFSIRPVPLVYPPAKPVQPDVVGFGAAAFASPAEPIVVPEPTAPEPAQKKTKV